MANVITGMEPSLGPTPVLCYVKGVTAYFTTCPLTHQYGDDWNDVPYECNAGAPYTWSAYMLERHGVAHYEITPVVFVGPYCEPRDYHECGSPYSVQRINQKVTPWLRPAFYAPPEAKPIFAGETLPMFRNLIERAGGHIFDGVEDALKDWPTWESEAPRPTEREYWLFQWAQQLRAHMNGDERVREWRS